MNKALKYKIVVLVVVCFLMILLPKGLNAPSQIQTISIATAVGVDKSENGVEISVQVLIPKPSSNYSPNYLIASAEGKNVPEAVENVQLKLGQDLGLAHCFVIVLGDAVCNENLADVLDYFMRSNIMGNNSALLHTDKTAKELLKQSSKLSESDVNNLQNIAKFNQEHYSSSNTNLISFFNNYLSKCPFSVIATVSVDDENQQESAKSGSESVQSGQTKQQGLQNEQQNNNQQQNSNQNEKSGSQSGQNSSQNQQKNKSQKNSQNSQNQSSAEPSNLQGQQSSSEAKVLKNEGKAIVVKKGKKMMELNREDLKKFEWLDSKAKKGFLILENVNNQFFQNAQVTLHITNKTIGFKAQVKNNQPTLNVDVFFEYVIDSIEQENQNESVHQDFSNESFKQEIEKQVKAEILGAITLFKQNNIDIADFFTKFNTQDTANWKHFLQTLDNPENYLQHIEIVSKISMHNKL